MFVRSFEIKIIPRGFFAYAFVQRRAVAAALLRIAKMGARVRTRLRELNLCASLKIFHYIAYWYNNVFVAQFFSYIRAHT